MTANDINKYPEHLGLGSTAEAEPLFTGEMNWYQAYVERHEKDGAEGRLVSMHTFDAPWSMWEKHPSGSEIVLCVAGEITLHQEGIDQLVRKVKLTPGTYAINPPNVWHTADVESTATALFITAGLGTEHRPR